MGSNRKFYYGFGKMNWIGHGLCGLSYYMETVLRYQPSTFDNKIITNADHRRYHHHRTSIDTVHHWTSENGGTNQVLK